MVPGICRNQRRVHIFLQGIAMKFKDFNFVLEDVASLAIEQPAAKKNKK